MSDLSLDPAAVMSSDGPMLIVAAGAVERERVSEPHEHERGELIGSSRGLLSIEIDGGVSIVPATHALWLPPRIRHSARSHGPFEGWVAFVAEDRCRNLPKRPSMIRTSGLLREAIRCAVDWPLAPLDARSTRIAEVILDEMRSLPVEPFGLPLPREPRLRRIATALIADPADDRDLQQWAKWAALSSRTLSRRFVSETGFSFTAWRQRARLVRSLEMLADDVPVTTIALDLGYSTASAFINAFKRNFGETPSAYRHKL